MAGSEYLLPNEWELAERRLTLLEGVHDPASIRRLRAVGVTQGSRCLEVGAGRGSIARWLCSEVGSTGSVVAVDIDTRLLSDIEANNLEVVQLDVVSDPLPSGPFDVIHARLLLMHLPPREEVLERLVALLAPGGTLVVEEHDSFPVLTAADGAYETAWSAFLRGVEAGGVATTWVRTLPAWCVGHGLVNVKADVDVAFFRGGSPEAEFWRLTWLQAAERTIAGGASRGTVDAGIAVLSNTALWFYGPAMVAVCASRV